MGKDNEQRRKETPKGLEAEAFMEEAIGLSFIHATHFRVPGSVLGAGDIRQIRCGASLKGNRVLAERGGRANKRGGQNNQ